MNHLEIKLAKVGELLSRRVRLQHDVLRFKRLVLKAESERNDIYNELYAQRVMRTGYYNIDGRNVRIIFNENSISVSSPKFKEVE